MHHVGRIILIAVGAAVVGILGYALFFGPYVVQVLVYDDVYVTNSSRISPAYVKLQADLFAFNSDIKVIKNVYRGAMIRPGGLDCSAYAYEAGFDLGLLEPCPTAVWTSSSVQGLRLAWLLQSKAKAIATADGITKYQVRIKRVWWVIHSSPPETLRVTAGE